MQRRRPAVPPLGSRILGPGREGTRRRRIRVQLLLTSLLVLANLIGSAIVMVLVAFVVPGPSVFTFALWPITFLAVPLYVVLALLLGIVLGTRKTLRALHWAQTDRAPSPAELRVALAVPWRLTLLQGLLWFGAFALFTLLYGIAEPQLIPKIAFTILLGGAVVCANSYLFSEFALRPIAAQALQADTPRAARAGVTTRMVLTWAVGSGVPVAGLMIIAIWALAKGTVTTVQLAVPMLAIGGVALATGLLLTLLVASSTVAPVRTVRVAQQRVAAGDLSADVTVFDGTELGQLQAGFNLMADGLRERERLRDLFGRHVGRDVARAALDHSGLGGEVREVAVIFVDLIGSTTIAATLPPTEVVDMLNRLFAVVVDEVDRYGGFVNKFEGDAALAIFGAPLEIDDHCGSALAAARAIADRLTVELTECRAAIGVAAGSALAGNVGAHARFEYTVIGDPVNEAARLCEFAKTLPGRTVASGRAVAGAAPAEAERWRCGDEVTLRGRLEPTRLAVPQHVA
ncbi:adenylate/guanylate cyclase domain-containing protein [Speluncibacter jeojiensis]|uniref:Adenylate/guanylate cyclase domain-containing protein n=1 Tax=Speluncibacter jeojiensis TaxID=2710754 RepID=A0A9X4M238_9ACTN|nr:adenylate/guanylate cyclase domain-containing protein [Corynebacteriales bacterium D3-21]